MIQAINVHIAMCKSLQEAIINEDKIKAAKIAMQIYQSAKAIAQANSKEIVQ